MPGDAAMLDAGTKAYIAGVNKKRSWVSKVQFLLLNL